MKHVLTCVVCPNGCDIEVDTAPDGAILSITGQTCRRGEAFARQEVLDPQRTISSSVRLIGGELPLVSVRLNRPVPRARIPEVMEAVRSLTLSAPTHIGDVALANVLGLGADLIVTKNVACAGHEDAFQRA